jgi:hypothetical protein
MSKSKLTLPKHQDDLVREDGLRVLEHLEKCEVRNGKWRNYVHKRATAVWADIRAKREFAAHDPNTTVAGIVRQLADDEERRLRAVLAH